MGKYREALAVLTGIVILLSGFMYVVKIRADLDAYVLADQQHQLLCQGERKRLRDDVTMMQHQMGKIYLHIFETRNGRTSELKL